MSIAFTFPGQGSQTVGMDEALAEAFPEARVVFEEVDDALGESLSRVMWEGSEDELTLTTNAQPTLMAVSLAAMRVLEARGLDLKASMADLKASMAYVAGHPLGEYSALAAAGSIKLADTARLLRTRSKAMQEAVPVREGAMAALLGLDFEAASEVAAAAAVGEVCEAANDNAPEQVVVSGHIAAVERALGLANDKGARRALLLPVSAPFHCSLMAPAAKVMAEALAEIEIASPAVPLVANVLAAPITESCGNPHAVGRAGDRTRALARIRCLAGGEQCHDHRQNRRGQGTDRHGQAHRQVA